ncbi:Predicted Na+/dicarboxylate symporter [Megamonas hypermegale ART12/1]|nr:Predicted Na+/dicarboxylate symporter [Megamonas hypermegale ART12/1]
MSRLVKKTILVTMSMVAVASIVGIAFGIFFNVGGDALTNVATEAKAKEIVSVATTLRGLIPGNLVDAMVKNNIIGMVIFGAFLGRAIWWIKADEPKVEEFMRKLVNGLHKALMNMALLILDYMPWAVIALLANTIAQKGLDSILSVVHFIFVLYLAIIAQFIIQLIALSVNGINPIVYMKKSLALLILAFTSRSSVGCLPVTIETLTQKLGVNQATASFVAGFGTTAGMQGCAGIFPSLLIVYVCHLTGTVMDFSMIVMTIIVVTLGSLGIAGIPGTATMAASVGLSGVGMASSFSLIGPILAIDPLIDMARTMLNVSGSVTNALIIDKRLGNLDENIYNEINKN